MFDLPLKSCTNWFHYITQSFIFSSEKKRWHAPSGVYLSSNTNYAVTQRRNTLQIQDFALPGYKPGICVQFHCRYGKHRQATLSNKEELHLEF